MIEKETEETQKTEINEVAEGTLTQNLSYLERIAEYQSRIGKGLDFTATTTMRIYEFATKKRKVGWRSPFIARKSR